MRKKAKIFKPDLIKTQICQEIRRDFSQPLHEYGMLEGSLEMLRSRQYEEIDKKYTSMSNRDESLRDLAFIKFMFVNEHMSNFGKEGLNLPTQDMVHPQSRYSERHNILLRARAILGFVLTPFLEDEWFQCAKHGTGSSIGVSFSDTSLEAKSSFPISVTKRARSLFDRYLDFDCQLKSAMLYHNNACPTGQKYDLVEASRATTVPKSNTIDRMIAVEPTGNMFLQQGLMEMMYTRMARCGLELEFLPTQHRRRAQMSSIHGLESTIDWTSASDCMSIELLRWLLPPLWFECCDSVRSDHILLEGSLVKLSMFSTMGNAVTFPLETLVFWSLAHACRLQMQGTLSCFPEWEDLLECSVFGDDCIVSSDLSDLFIEICESVGFLCNRSKTFTENTGFRESCGGDFFHGYDVRPFNLKGPTSAKLSSLEPWLYIVMNRIIPKYISCFGSRDYVYDRGFFKLMLRIFDEYKLQLKLVPHHFPDDSGLRWTKDVQRFIANYPFTLSRVGVDHHGSYTFRFCRFQYRQRTTRVEDLHYASWLKRPGGERSPWWSTRKVGGYVVAKGRSGHWSLPSVYDA